MSAEVHDRVPWPSADDRRARRESFLREARNGMHLPLPGSGDTAARFERFRAEAAADAGVGRLLEAHADAIAILHEAGHELPDGGALAVWAAGGPEPLRLVGDASCGSFHLDGGKVFCGGASMVDAALVTADGADGQRLVLVDLRLPGVEIDDSSWTSAAFGDAGIATVHFRHVRVGAASVVGPPNWYGTRTGFWHGAVGVAALWAGMADSIAVRLPGLLRRDDQLTQVAIGEVHAARWAMGAALSAAAAEIDLGPGRAQARVALSCRYAVRTAIERLLQVFDQEVGPGPFASDPDLERVRHELGIALLQSHGPRDLATIAFSRAEQR